MARRVATKPKKGFMDVYTKSYDVETEGYGNPHEWRNAFSYRMGFDEAKRVRTEAQAQGRWRSEYQVIGDMADVILNESSMWGEIKSAFRKASMNCHPDRAEQIGKDPVVAEEEFKKLNAAYTLLERKHGEN